MAANTQQDCLAAIATGLALIRQFQQTLSTPPSDATSAGATTELSSPLLLLRVAALSLKTTITKLSLLSITPPFTGTALNSLLKPLNDSTLPSLVTAALLVTDPIAVEARRIANVTLTELAALLELIVQRTRDGKPKAEPSKEQKQSITEATGRIWEICDALVKFSQDGVPGFVVQKADQWLALMRDAVQELRDWNPEEDVDEDIFGDGDSDQEDSSKFTDKANDYDQVTIAAGVKDQALKVLSRIPQSMHIVVKQRLAKLPADIKSGDKQLTLEQKKLLNRILRDTRNISEHIDESAEALYMGDPELCLKKAGEARALTISIVESVLKPWDHTEPGAEPTKEDTFIKRALLWVKQVDTQLTLG